VVQPLVAGVPQPLIRQAVLFAAVLVDLVLLLLWGEAGKIGGFYWAGLSLLLATIGVAAGASLKAVPAGVVLLLPLVDLAAIGLMRLVPGGNGLGILAVLPAMWLAADLRMRGVGLTVVGTLGLVTAPSLFYFGLEHSWWSRGLLVPTVAGMCALTVAGTAQVWHRQNQELERQGKRLQEALREATVNRALNDAIVSTVDVGLVALDRDGAYKSVNPRHVDFLRLAYPDGHRGRAGQPGAVYAADRETLLAPADMPTVRAMNGERFSDQVIWVGEPRSGQRALSVSAGTVVDAAGEFDGAVLAYKDITELMSALKVKDDFVASVSHELRTPLTSIMGFLDLVLDEDDSVDPEVREQLEVVKRNSERLLGLVSDLLSTAQTDGGRLKVHVRTFDVTALVHQAVLEMSPRATASDIDLQHHLPGPLPMQADPTRVRQMVDNLLSNALKYTPTGGTVVVRLEERGHEVAFVVRDTGIGISPADLERLFTRFFRARDAEARAIQGIGLGLAITKSIVESHDGRIEVDSEGGRGSTFTVLLPRGGPGRLPPVEAADAARTQPRSLSGGADAAPSAASAATPRV
jgi:signal transduction histidine kinase